MSAKQFFCLIALAAFSILYGYAFYKYGKDTALIISTNFTIAALLVVAFSKGKK